jgi:sterol desaturase/sphingolipid hydroxylase (fatty acid hydroxylase superfamily)
MLNKLIGGALLTAYAWAAYTFFGNALIPVVLSRSNGDERLAFALCVGLTNLLTLLLFNGFFLCLYVLQLPGVEARRVLRRPWPWQAPAPAARTAFWRLCRDSAVLTAVNTTLVALPLSYLSAPLSLLLNPRLLDPGAAPAFFPGAVGALLFFALLDDVFFYCAHRALHHPRLYWLHKPHHAWTHTVSIAVLHLHPLEFLLANALPAALGPLLLRAHLSLTLAWIHLRLAQTIEAHSNYALEWSPFVRLGVNGGGEAHEMHHSENIGNFGSFTAALDTLCGTRIHGRRGDDDFEKVD